MRLSLKTQFKIEFLLQFTGSRKVLEKIQILSAKQIVQFFGIEEYLQNDLIAKPHFLLLGLASFWSTYWISFSYWRSWDCLGMP